MDIGKAVTFITEDERWLEKLGIGVALLLITGVVENCGDRDGLHRRNDSTLRG